MADTNRYDYQQVLAILQDIIEPAGALDRVLSKAIKTALTNHPDYILLSCNADPGRLFKLHLKPLVKDIAPNAYPFRNATERGFGGVKLKGVWEGHDKC